MKSSFLRLSLVIAVVALSVTVFSAPASAQFYAGVKGSVFLPNSSDDGLLEEFDTGFGGELFAGYRFMPYFGLEAGAGYYQTKFSQDSFMGTGIDVEDTVSAIPLTLTAKGYLPMGDRARLYLGVGGGVYFASDEFDASAPIPGEPGLSVNGSAEGDDVAFGYHAVFGGEFMLSSAVGLQAEARWFKVEPEFEYDEINETDEFDIGGVMISFGVLFQM